MLLPAQSVEQAVLARLRADNPLKTALGGARIYQLPKRNTSFPYITLSVTQSEENSTGTEAGERHIMTLHIWTSGGKLRQAQHILAAAKAALLAYPVPAQDHKIIYLNHRSSEIIADPKRHHCHAIARYHCATEPL